MTSFGDLPPHPQTHTQNKILKFILKCSDGNKENAAPEERFNKLVLKARELASQGQVRKALELNKTALKLFYSEKVERRISKMEVGLIF